MVSEGAKKHRQATGLNVKAENKGRKINSPSGSYPRHFNASNLHRTANPVGWRTSVTEETDIILFKAVDKT